MREAQSAFNDLANSYQDILIRGHLMPNRDVSRDVAEAEYDREFGSAFGSITAHVYPDVRQSPSLDDTGRHSPEPDSPEPWT